MSDSDKVSIIWNEYANHNEWQRHNENQRAQLANVLLIISAALVAFLSNDLKRSNWPIPAFLIIIGVFGVLAVMKYWERFMYHVQHEKAYRKTLDLYFASDSDQITTQENQFLKTRNQAINAHENSQLPLLKDKYLMQHWLWEGIFGLVALLGVILVVQALST